jgi:hypothetical protein
MGHNVWYDKKIKGGQAWWKEILRNIRECDLFILILTPKFLESQSCKSEYQYAFKLKKRILPVLCHDEVKVNILPPELFAIHYVDYRSQDRSAAFDLVRALQVIPHATSVPDHLPPEPPIPISYLGDLRSQIESDQQLSFEDQRNLLFEVKRRIEKPESFNDTLGLLKLLLRREDLLARIANEINLILNHYSRDKKDQTSREETLSVQKEKEIIKTPSHDVEERNVSNGWRAELVKKDARYRKLKLYLNFEHEIEFKSNWINEVILDGVSVDIGLFSDIKFTIKDGNNSYEVSIDHSIPWTRITKFELTISDIVLYSE